MWVVHVPPTTHIPSFTKISHCVLIRERRFTFDVDEKPTSVHIHTPVHEKLWLKLWARSDSNCAIFDTIAVTEGPLVLTQRLERKPYIFVLYTPFIYSLFID